MNKRDIVFIPHALERMNERGISKELVIKALPIQIKLEKGILGEKSPRRLWMEN